LNAAMRQGIYTNITWQYVDDIAMNDANNEYADAYRLLGTRIGWRFSLKQKLQFDLFAAGDNLLNETYSLGNDINAAANRFYNAAAGRNFAVGLGVRWR